MGKTQQKGAAGTVISCGIAAALCCMVLLILTALIPQHMLQTQMEQSAEYYDEHLLFDRVTSFSFLSRQDNYADCILTDIIYHIDSSKPVTSVLRAAYYNPEGEDVNTSFAYAVEHEAEPDVDYARYWHGSMVLLRPLFVFFDIETVRMLLGLVFLGLTIWFGCLLLKNRYRLFFLCYLTGLISVSVWMCAFCLEYVMTFLIMGVELPVLFLLLTLAVNKKNGRNMERSLWCVLSVSGVVTAFLDFLTTETLTFTLAYVLYLVIRSRAGLLKSKKEEIKGLIKSGMVWGLSYVGMMVLKWLLAGVFLGKEAVTDALCQAALRIGGDATLGNAADAEVVSDAERIFGALWRNAGCLLPIRDQMTVRTVLIFVIVTGILCFSIWYMFHEKGKGDALHTMLLITGIIPVARFLALNNHSYIHFFFTYRALLVTVVVMLYVFLEYIVVWKSKI